MQILTKTQGQSSDRRVPVSRWSEDHGARKRSSHVTSPKPRSLTHRIPLSTHIFPIFFGFCDYQDLLVTRYAAPRQCLFTPSPRPGDYKTTTSNVQIRKDGRGTDSASPFCFTCT